MSDRRDDRNSSESLPRNVRLLGWASFGNDVASEMIYPLLPQFLIGVLGGSRLQLGLMEELAESVSSLLKLWSGARSDRARQRKGFVVAGYALAAVARPVMGLVEAPWQLLIARSADRVGKGIRTAPRDALIAESADASIRGRAFGFHRAMDHLGAATGPLLAMTFLWVWPEGLRTLFLLTVLPGLAVVGLLVFGLKEGASQQANAGGVTAPVAGGTPVALGPGAGGQPRDRTFAVYLLALVIFTLGNSSDAFLLVRASELGISTVMLPLLWLVFHVAKSSGNLWGGRLVDRIGPRTPILIGWTIYAAVYLGFGCATAAWHAWTLFLGYAAFYALTEPAEKTLVARLVASDRHGWAFGWYNFAIGIAALPASLIFGAIYESLGPLSAFGWGAALALIAGAVLLAAGVSRSPAGQFPHD